MTNGEKKAAKAAVKALLREISGALKKNEEDAKRSATRTMAEAAKKANLLCVVDGVARAIGLDSERDAFAIARSLVETLGEKALQRIDGGAP
jgi:predicted TIM-barrel fold metal-dependent hydrolase